MIDFPTSPAVGTVVTSPNGTSWRYDGSAWLLGTGMSAAGAHGQIGYVQITTDIVGLTGPVAVPSLDLTINVVAGRTYRVTSVIGYSASVAGTMAQTYLMEGSTQRAASTCWIGVVGSVGVATTQCVVTPTVSGPLRYNVLVQKLVGGAATIDLKAGTYSPSFTLAEDITYEAGNVVGPPGPAGVAGPVGPAGPTGPPGEVTAAQLATKVAKAGDTMTGTLHIAAEYPKLMLQGSDGIVQFIRNDWEQVGSFDWNTGNGQFNIYGFPGRPGAAAGAKALFRLGVDDAVSFPDASLVTTPAKFTSGNIRDGYGSPQNVVAAPVGTKYIDTNGTNGAVEWVKAVGASSNGWQVVFGDTGWRTITSLLVNGWVASKVQIRRINNEMWLSAEGLTPGDPMVATSNVFITLPTGFKCYHALWLPVGNTTSNIYAPTTYNASISNTNGDLYFDRYVATYLYTTAFAPVDDDWPTILPGTPG